MAGKKVLLVMPPRDFDDDCYEGIRRALEQQAHTIQVASLGTGVIRGSQGTAALAEVKLDNVKSYDYDAIIFIGGEGATLLFDYEKARQLAKDAKYKVLGAIGNAVAILALSGAAEKKRATSPTEWAGWLVEGGATYTGRPLEVDDKFITAQDATVVEQFANAVVKALQ
ncbi:MAG: DJ-1/PfpI family protein [Chloroflexi bacterium]|nr:DJ-1/PfpI family protein [Chloroflexota bacterium]